MKNKIFFSILIVISIALSAFAWKFYNVKGKTQIEVVKAAKLKSTVLMVVTGFSSGQSNISFEELLSKLCDGKIYILKSANPYLDEYIKTNNPSFGIDCMDPKILSSINEFSAIAKDNILITDLDNLPSTYKALSFENVNFFENPDKYKFYTGDKFDFKNLITKFTMTGVTAITRAAGRTADREGIDFLTKNLKPYFQDSELVHISNEVSFKDSCEYVAGTTRFCTKEIHFKALTDLHCNIVELTGNHNRDYGDKAYKKTFQWYKDQNIKTFGGGLNPEEANTPLIITLKDGKKVGFIGFNEACPLGECSKKTGEPGANYYEKEKAKKVVRKMKEELKVDYIIASVQFTECDKYEPHSMQLKISHELIDFGADFVYGSQAHQIQQLEFYKGKPIFHGLGNFLFDQIHRTGVRQAFFLQHYFYKGKIVQTIPVYTFMKDNRQQSIATKEQRAEMEKLVLLDSMLYRKY